MEKWKGKNVKETPGATTQNNNEKKIETLNSGKLVAIAVVPRHHHHDQLETNRQ